MKVLHCFLPALIVTSLLFVVPRVSAGEAFSKERFMELQVAKQPVLIDVRADWCPTCKKQRQILTQFQKDNPQCGLTILEVDFDRQKDWVKHFRAPRQSTLLLYRGTEQVWFSVAETRPDVIRQKIFDSVKACGKHV
ncbi:thioredoxin family protein [Microbulbifer spongiae]|uniref:Thioredoxin family protein n=1 Tax=Microbulbifer spongiae TaxID=2944933 RepID=A0ABY9EBR1_9GAMM|nr:thioredoxin family protein [Microbulbifer sp. MI-G]WKD50454.1 thioredoxin family protein [Microbulbifer sp. MI-G]